VRAWRGRFWVRLGGAMYAERSVRELIFES
jgi:hypothetical protein